MKHRGSKPQAPKPPTPPRLPPSAPSGQEAIRQLAVQTRIDLWLATQSYWTIHTWHKLTSTGFAHALQYVTAGLQTQ